jgi:hypothetical protein
LRSERCFTNQSDADADGSKDQWLLATNFVEKEYDENEVEYRTDDVINAGHKQITVSVDSKVLIQDGGVVADNIDSAIRQRETTANNEIKLQLTQSFGRTSV